jgi:hypothetical protein
MQMPYRDQQSFVHKKNINKVDPLLIAAEHSMSCSPHYQFLPQLEVPISCNIIRDYNEEEEYRGLLLLLFFD